MKMTDDSWLDEAFPPSSQRPLNKRIRDVIGKDPKYYSVFRDIGDYILELKSAHPDLPVGGAPPVAKKRKIDGENDREDSAPITTSSGEPVLAVKEISFSVPQRKKFTLVLTSDSLIATSPTTGDVEFGVRWDNIQYIACLAVPEKAARQFNFCIFPTGAEGLGDGNAEAMVFTIADGPPKTASGNAMGAGHDTTSYKSLLIDVFNQYLTKAKVQEPIESAFYSALPQSHRKSEKAFHVKAHRGSKDGYLYLLKSGIIWAFKKPLAYFSFGAISSISYTSITKRTFNLNIHVSDDRGGAEIEFGMIDQEEYPGIDAYIKRNQLNDASMAEARKAKMFNVNGKGEDGEGEAAGGELEKALDDAEDEEEEDYVPGEEEDDSGGSGSEDESDDDGDDEDMGSDEEGSVDLEDELGSEMEDVDVDQKRVKRERVKRERR
ncbi:hypothetical protein RUND412_009236 [Rhizina undulata]